jgi:hypothetical protein
LLAFLLAFRRFRVVGFLVQLQFWPLNWDFFGALGGIRTPNLLIRSQML